MPTERLVEICNTTDFDPSADRFLPSPPQTRFAEHAQEARGALFGRVRRIHHGFHAVIPALLPDLDTGESLFSSNHKPDRYVVVPPGGHVHGGTRYCSPGVMGASQPSVGDRLIFMPVSDPWDKDGEIMLILDPGKVFLVGKPDPSGLSVVTSLRADHTSVPPNLVDFRRRLQEVRSGALKGRTPVRREPVSTSTRRGRPAASRLRHPERCFALTPGAIVKEPLGRSLRPSESFGKPRTGSTE